MAIIKASFGINNNQFKNGSFKIDNLRIAEKNGKLDVLYDEIELYLDGELYDESFTTWRGDKLRTCNIFEQVLSAYLREDYSDYSEYNGFEVFEEFEALKKRQGNLLTKIPVYDYALRMYELDLATPSARYYYCEDTFLLLDENNGILTDMECWYESAIIEDVCAILKGERECLYKSKNIDEWIESCGGKESFLEAYEG